MKETNLAIISLDGVDASGKSTLAETLKARAPEYGFSPEFSETIIGQFLKIQVASNPHLIARSRLAQSLLFLAEYCDHMESARLQEPAADAVIIMERGWLSKYSYQVCVLESTLGYSRAHNLVAGILSAMPQPDASVLLRVSPEVMQKRLRTRGIPVDSHFMDFVQRADELMAKAVQEGHPALVIDTSDRTPGQIADIAIPYCRSAVEARKENA
jgi:thymidylate kinase